MKNKISKNKKKDINKIYFLQIRIIKNLLYTRNYKY